MVVRLPKIAFDVVAHMSLVHVSIPLAYQGGCVCFCCSPCCSLTRAPLRFLGALAEYRDTTGFRISPALIPSRTLLIHWHISCSHFSVPGTAAVPLGTNSYCMGTLGMHGAARVLAAASRPAPLPTHPPLPDAPLRCPIFS